MGQYVISYHSEIKIYNNDTQDIEFSGQIIIDCNNFCEGIVCDKDHNKYLIFGYFEKFNCLELFLVLKDKVNKYCGKMTYLKYEGSCETIQDDTITSVKDFYISVRGLDVDPRDYQDDNPSVIFKQNLNEFKYSWLLERNNKFIYEKYCNNTKKKILR